MSNDIEIIEDADQLPSSMFLSGQKFTEQDALDAVDELLESLERTSDLAPVDMTLKSLLGMQRISGKALAKLLWGTKQWWELHVMDRVTGDTFEDRMRSIHRIKPIVMERYIMLWEKYEQNALPEPVRERPLKDQIAISQALEQGYVIGKNQWRQLEQAENNSEVLRILRDVKGKQPRKSSIDLVEERDGTMVAWDSDGGRHFIAALNVQDEEEDSTVHKALMRIRKGSGSRRK